MTASNSRRAGAAFTLVEILVAMGVFGAFAAALLTMWTTLGYSALNTTNFSSRQNDQMRVLDYIKRDIRRATKIELYNGATLVTATNVFASELRLTIPDLYADTNEEDDPFGPKITNIPIIMKGAVAYGTPLTLRYYALGGAGIRREESISRTITNTGAAFEFSFKRETNGAIHCRIAYDQLMRGGSERTVRRQVDTLCVPRSELQL